MGENLNTVDAVQENAVGSQSEQVNSTVETVNADNASVTTDKQEEIKPAQSAEENAKYAEVRRRAEAEAKAKARDEVINEMYGESHGIHTYAEYQAAIEKQKQEEQLQELLAKNIPEEFATEMLESRKLREQIKAEQEAKQQQEKQQADMMDFITAFPDVKADEIPVEVWKANASGIPLRYAYAEHALKLAREADAKARANAENAKGSMGSVNGDGAANEADFISYDTFEKNKGDLQWITKNYEKIQKSRANW
jgi:hypothetical protein